MAIKRNMATCGRISVNNKLPTANLRLKYLFSEHLVIIQAVARNTKGSFPMIEVQKCRFGSRKTNINKYLLQFFFGLMYFKAHL